MTADFHIQTLLFFALFSIISVRERRAFWAPRPGTLLEAHSRRTGFGIFIGIHGLAELRPLPLSQSLVVLVVAAALVLGPNDALKACLTGRALKRQEREALEAKR